MPSLLPIASSTSRRSRQRLETRERLYTAALAEFREVGFVAASVERIVAATGVARGTFYFHFPTKDHVLLELQRRHESEIVERLALLPDSVSIVALVRAVVEGVLAEEERIGDTRLFRDLLAVYLRRPEGVDLGDPAFPLAHALVGRFLAAADRGAVRDDVWRSLDLSQAPRGGPADLAVRLPAGDYEVEELGLDTVPEPTAGEEPHIKELQF